MREQEQYDIVLKTSSAKVSFFNDRKKNSRPSIDVERYKGQANAFFFTWSETPKV